MSPVNGPLQRATPDPGLLPPGVLGTQPSGPRLALWPTTAQRKRRPNVGRVGSPASAAAARPPVPDQPHPLGFLPKPSTVDYAHKLTSTTLLLAGVAGLILFGPKRPRTILRRLGSKHVLPFGG